MLSRLARLMQVSALCGRLRHDLLPPSLLFRRWSITTLPYLLTLLHQRLHRLRYPMLLRTHGIYLWKYLFQPHLLLFPSIFLLSLILLCLLPFHLLHHFRPPTHLPYNLLYHLHLRLLHAVVAPCARRLAFVRLPTRPYTPTRPPTPLTSMNLQLAFCNRHISPIQNLTRWL